MKAIVKFLAIFAIMLMVGCSKEDDSVPPDTTEAKVTFMVNTNFPAGVTVGDLEVVFESDKTTVKTRSISMGADQITFTGQEAKDLMGGNIRANLIIADPLFNGSPCQLIFSGDEQISLNVQGTNYLNWSLEVDQTSLEGIKFIVTKFFPDQVTVDRVSFILYCQANEETFDCYISNIAGTDTITLPLEATSKFLNYECQALLSWSTALLNGNACVIVPVEQFPAVLTTAAVNSLTWHFTL